jgi:co-chaperonin GroES (HSP10)
MADEKNKDKKLRATRKMAQDLIDETRLPSLRSSSSRMVRTINPLGMRVLVKIRERSDVTDGGLYLPESAKDSTAESLIAEVLEVASAHDHDKDEATNISGIPLGSIVLIPKKSGTKIPWDENLRIVETKEILALIEEISIT